MKSIEQTAEVSFTCIEISDAIIVIPIMDALATSLETQENVRIGGIEISAEIALNIYRTLRNVGFCNSMGKDPEIVTRLGEYK